MTTTNPAVYQDRHLTLDYRRHELRSAGELVFLTPTEFRLLVEFTDHPGLPLSNTQLVGRVFGEEYEDRCGRAMVKWHVSRLRRKMGWGVDGPLVTVKGWGYRYDGRPTS